MSAAIEPVQSPDPPDHARIDIVEAYGVEPLSHVRRLLTDYAESQGFTPKTSAIFSDLAALPGRYLPPEGRLVLARVAGQAAGCGGLVRISERDAELKRVCVAPAFRGAGIGRAVSAWLLREAARAGYGRVVLSTKESWAAAIGLYRSLGFAEIAPFREIKMPDLVWMGLELART